MFPIAPCPNLKSAERVLVTFHLEPEFPSDQPAHVPDLTRALINRLHDPSANPAEMQSRDPISFSL